MPLSPQGRACKWLGLLALTVMLGVSGCGGGVGTVSGTVSLKNGTKLKGGNVVFIPVKGQSVPAKIGEDGKYTAENVPAGPVTITVETESLNPKKVTGMAAMMARGGAPKDSPNAPPDPKSMAARFVPIPDPDKYADQSKSPLKYTVTKGPQSHDITID